MEIPKQLCIVALTPLSRRGGGAMFETSFTFIKIPAFVVASSLVQSETSANV